MKTQLLAAILLVVSTAIGAPARHEEIPPEAIALQKKLLPRLSPSVRAWISREAAQLRVRRNVDENAVRASVRKRFDGQTLSTADTDAMFMLLMLEMLQAKSGDLQDQVTQVQESNARKCQLKDKLRDEHRTNAPAASSQKLDGMNEMSEMTSLRLQMTMDRRNKFISTLSNIMKKISTTQDMLVQNLK